MNFKFVNIFNNDCLTILRNLPNECIDLVITSPPYNLNIKYKGSYKDNKKENEYLWFIKTVMIELKRVLKPTGQIFLNIGYTNKSPLIDMKIAIALEDLFVLQNRITWVKNISIEMKDEDKKNMKKEHNVVSFGHIKPINSPRYTSPTNESIFHYTKTGEVKVDRNSIGVPYKWKCNIKERSKKKNKTGDREDCRDRGNTWYIPYKTIKSRNKDRKSHPATFPKQLVEYCIKFSGVDKNAIILDPFLGSGTTCLVAQEMKFKSVGIELSSEYYQSVIQDFKELFKETNIIENDTEFIVKKRELVIIDSDDEEDSDDDEEADVETETI